MAKLKFIPSGALKMAAAKKGKKPRPVSDPEQIFHHASRFLATDQALRKTFGGTEWGQTIAAPTMVLSAFASEL